ncbi:MAG TPA: hypothetical protein VHL98_09800 [Microvirga sp.]|jgi:hypothetical protein|nr:hypothetical protein [Microvirga sp.]
MLRASLFRSHLVRPLLAAALIGAGPLTAAAPALAQSNTCAEGQKYFVTAQSLTEQLTKSAVKGKQLDARAACPILTKMVANGEAGAKWLEGNRDWCQVPPQVADSFTQSVGQFKNLRGKACEAAAKIAEMEKQAKAQAGRGGGRLGGEGLTGEFKIPQGAL